ncbi:MAG: NAD(P)-binding protein [Nitriliruptoraceae bacterium]
MQRADTDYLVVGAGAMGMAFADTLVAHCPAHVTIVDRRTQPGGHWVDAYPFVRLHQASMFYGAASTVLGDGTIQSDGPEAGLHERATVTEILAYYDDVMRRLTGTGQVTFLAGCDYQRDGDEHVAVNAAGEQVQLTVRQRVVDATYLSPAIPATSPPPFAVADDGLVVTPGQLPAVADAGGHFVIVGSGKTATDAIVWLLGLGVDPDRIAWVRPRDPWMLNRAVVQPDAAVITTLAADTMEAAALAASVDDMFLRLETAGAMLRIDPDVTPTMARTPTLGVWELELLRTIARVVRMGHVTAVSATEICLQDGVVPLPRGAVVVHCAASGLPNPGMVPVWGHDGIRLQTVRTGFPCFCAALAGYVEATRDDDVERNRLCPPNIYGDGLQEWSIMQARGIVAAATYGAEQDIATWANATTLNPSRTGPDDHEDPRVQAAATRLAAHAESGLANLIAFGQGELVR